MKPKPKSKKAKSVRPSAKKKRRTVRVVRKQGVLSAEEARCLAESVVSVNRAIEVIMQQQHRLSRDIGELLATTDRLNRSGEILAEIHKTAHLLIDMMEHRWKQLWRVSLGDGEWPERSTP
jgi:hypothetical protein